MPGHTIHDPGFGRQGSRARQGTRTQVGRHEHSGAQPSTPSLQPKVQTKRTHITRQGKTDKNTGHLPDFRVAFPGSISGR
jgi:hypothetical protein